MLKFFTFIAWFLHVIEYVLHYSVQIITSWGDACLWYHADNVNLPTTSQAVWLQRACHQPSTRCDFICLHFSKAAVQARDVSEDTAGSISSWLPSSTCCCTRRSQVIAGKQQVLTSKWAAPWWTGALAITREWWHYNNHITSLERIDIRGLLPAFPRWSIWSPPSKLICA